MAQQNDRPSDPAPDHAVGQPMEGRPGEQQDGIILAHAEVASWDAPLPPPVAFQMYENTLPGAAERLLAISEREQSHRHNLENAALATTDRTVTGDSRRSYLGIILAFVLAMTGLLGGIFLIAIGHGGFGLTLCLAPLAGLAAVFVYGTRSRRSERERNADASASAANASAGAGSDPAGAE